MPTLLEGVGKVNVQVPVAAIVADCDVMVAEVPVTDCGASDVSGIAAMALLTNAVVATLVELSPAVGVGAVTVPVNAAPESAAREVSLG